MQVLALGVLIVAVAAYLVACYQLRERIADDAYISFRFARNLAEGHGLVWNIGGEPVEGYTNALWVFLLAGIHAIGLDIETVQPWLAIAATLGTVGLILSIARQHLGGLHPWVALFVAFYLADRYAAVHSMSGMETQLFVLLLCLMAVLALQFVDSPSRSRAVLLGAAMFSSVLCRPDGMIFVAGTMLVLAVAAWWSAVDPSPSMRQTGFALCTATFFGLVSAYAIWKYNYFGYLLPNSFYVKSHPPHALSFAGWGDVRLFFDHVVNQIGLLLLVALLAAILEVPRLMRDRRVRLKVSLIILPPLLAVGYYSTIIHEVGFAGRFSYPTYFFLVIGGAATASVATRRWCADARYRMATVTVVTLMALGIIIARGDWHLRSRGPGSGNIYHGRIADALKKTGFGPEAVVMTVAAGLIPYRSRFNHVDPVGLTDNFLSGRRPITPDEYEDYLWSQQADVYIGWEPPAQKGATSPDDDAVMHTRYVDEILLGPSKYRMQMNHPRFGGTTPEKRRRLLYRRMRELRDHWIFLGQMENKALWRYVHLKSFLYVRRDSPRAETLQASLAKITSGRPSLAMLNTVP